MLDGPVVRADALQKSGVAGLSSINAHG